MVTSFTELGSNTETDVSVFYVRRIFMQIICKRSMVLLGYPLVPEIKHIPLATSGSQTQ
jgi:hypothetical protein